MSQGRIQEFLNGGQEFSNWQPKKPSGGAVQGPRKGRSVASKQKKGEHLEGGD